MDLGILPVTEDRSWYRKKFTRGTLAAQHLAKSAEMRPCYSCTQNIFKTF
jgi:hypothetical protein